MGRERLQQLIFQLHMHRMDQLPQKEVPKWDQGSYECRYNTSFKILALQSIALKFLMKTENQLTTITPHLILLLRLAFYPFFSSTPVIVAYWGALRQRWGSFIGVPLNLELPEKSSLPFSKGWFDSCSLLENLSHVVC